jgi:hypothetical protein
MPIMIDALLSVDAALALRALACALLHRDVSGGDIGFTCPECKQRVRPTKEGISKNGVRFEAHFEHLTRNLNCSLSDPLPIN